MTVYSHHNIPSPSFITVTTTAFSLVQTHSVAVFTLGYVSVFELFCKVLDPRVRRDFFKILRIVSRSEYRITQRFIF